MFRTLKRIILPNPFDAMLRKTARSGGKRILLCWNRGLGDIALGLYAMVQRIKDLVPEAEITFLARENLLDGFSMLEGVTVLPAPWKRGEKPALNISKSDFDLIIEEPDPTEWVRWQRGKIIPRLKWNAQNDSLFARFALEETSYIGVQVSAETHYGLWRNWHRWSELFDLLAPQKILLFGYGSEPQFSQSNVIDLRGKTTLFELLSIIKHKCHTLVLPDSGILSMVYYLDTPFPIRLISLWADPRHGILKQAVASPNPQLVHVPLIAENRDLSTLSARSVFEQIPNVKPQYTNPKDEASSGTPQNPNVKPLYICPNSFSIKRVKVEKTAAIILAGGQGTRLGFDGPKGLFSLAGKSLFQRLCEKAPDLPIAVMTSPANHRETVAFFEKHHFWGKEVYFFQQETLPFLDEEKNVLQVEGPNGNGNVFRAFAKAGLIEVFREKAIEFVTVSAIDNVLCGLFDSALISCGKQERADVVVQCIRRGSEDRSMGVLVQRGERIEIVEYTELDPLQEYKYAYSGQLGFQFSFFCKMAQVVLPIHWVRKKLDGRFVWKGEQFIFDVLSKASRVCALEVERETHYAPLKSREQVKAIEEVLGHL